MKQRSDFLKNILREFHLVIPPSYRTKQYCSSLRLLEEPIIPKMIYNYFRGTCLPKKVFSSFTTACPFKCI